MTDEEKWNEELKEGKLSQDEFDFLMKSKKAVGEMDDLVKGEDGEKG